METDIQSALTLTFTPTDPHGQLAAFHGEWAGPVTTWFGPDSAPRRDRWRLSATPALGGRFLRVTYTGTVDGKPHAGQMMVGYHTDQSQWEIAWQDSFHCGTSTLFSVGQGAHPTALGSYPAGPERWGWRTELGIEDGAFVVRMYNITPGGEEMLGVEAVLRRV